MATATKKIYSLTEEHRKQLEPWRDRWIAIALRTEPMTDTDRAAMRAAIDGLHDAAKLERVPDERKVFVSSPLVAAVAAGIAAGVWWLREDSTRHRALFGRALSEEEIILARDLASTGRWADLRLHGVRDQATEQATNQATDQATRQATWEATHQATRQATNQATDQATDQATRQATEQATWEATDQATHQATHQATDQATWEATRQATEQATNQATNQATRQATWEATHQATWEATHQATHQATNQATRQATDQATWEATNQATRQAINDPIIAAALFLVRCTGTSWYMRNGGNQWAGWCSYLSFFDRIVGLDLPEHSAWRHYESATIHGGPKYMHPRFCIVSDFPARILKDERHRPHAENTFSHRWRDGWTLYHHHGIRVDERVALGRFTAVDVDAEPNAEIRRCMVEIMGEERYLRDGNARLLHEDTDALGQPRRLWRKDGVGDDEPVVMVEVQNSTVEPDGNRRTFFLPVHHELRPLFHDGDDAEGEPRIRLGEPQAMTCHAAVASTFGLRAEEYRPEMET